MPGRTFFPLHHIEKKKEKKKGVCISGVPKLEILYMFLSVWLLHVSESNNGVWSGEWLTIFFCSCIANAQMQSLEDTWHFGSPGAKWPRCHHHHLYPKPWLITSRKPQGYQARRTQEVLTEKRKKNPLWGIPCEPHGIAAVQYPF